METFQKKLNQTRAVERRINWKKHRQQVTGLFNDVFSKKDPVDKIAIFGAGNCDDLDLDDLATKCHWIYLFDLDLESMERGIEHYSEQTRQQIKLIEVDVTGLNTLDFNQQLVSMLKRNEQTEQIIQFLIDTMQHLNGISGDERVALINSFDIVATSAMYTQLFYNWAMDTLSEYKDQYNQQDLDKIKEGFLDLRDHVIVTFHKSVFSFCHEDGFFVTWTDLFQMKPKYNEVLNQGPNAIFTLATNIGYGAAMIGIKDFIDHVDKEEFALRYWLWDFSKDKQYLTMGLLGKLNR